MGEVLLFYHMQECCESVYLESADSIENNVDIYTGASYISIEEIHSDMDSDLNNCDDFYCKWTFYKIVTDKGYNVLRWYGSSNGYYGVDVDIAILDTEEAMYL